MQMLHFSKKQKVIAVVVTVCVLLAVIALLSTLRTTPLDTARFNQLPVTQELLTRFVANNPALHTAVAPSSSLWWVDTEGYSVLVPTNDAILIAIEGRSGKPGMPIPDQFFSKELKIAREVFSRRGFSLNEKNSSMSTEDERLYDYVQAYQKGNELCTMVVNPDLGSYEGGGIQEGYTLSVGCTDAFEDAASQQRPLVDALDVRNKEIAVSVIHEQDPFFEVSMHARRAGQTAVLKREGSGFRVLLVSQEEPLCEVVDKEKIPSSVLSSIGSGACLTNTGSYRKGIE